MSTLVTAWIVTAIVCAVAGAMLYGKNVLAGVTLGALFGPLGLIVAAIANMNATLEETAAKAPRDPSRAPVPVAVSRVVCWKCSEDYPQGMLKCPHCGAKARG